MELAIKKADQKTVELEVKRQEYEYKWQKYEFSDRARERDGEKDRLLAEERQLAAKERMMEKDHIRQREKELHEERLLRLRIELAQTSGGQGTQVQPGPAFDVMMGDGRGDHFDDLNALADHGGGGYGGY